MKCFAFCLGLWLTALSAEAYQAKNYHHLIEQMPKINPNLLETHFKLYQGYVAQVNRLDLLLTEERKGSIDQSFTYQSIKRRYGWEYDGMILHELYFDNLGGNGKLDPQSNLYKKIATQFGSYANWLQDFQATALIRGFGWTILCWHPKTNTLFNVWITEHDTGSLTNCIPLLVVDLWEHAYLCQFQLDRTSYINTIFEYINWSVVAQRLNL